jgi:hypothetical protein
MKILDCRMVTRGGTQVPQVLIQWIGLPPDLATWEDRDALKQLFPGAPTWAQAAFQGGETVSISNDLEQKDWPKMKC